MAPAPGFDEAVAIFSKITEISCGVHLTLTAEWDNIKYGPVLAAQDVPSLVDTDGHFFSSTAELWGHQPQLDEMLMRIERRNKYT